jgi:leucyl aminopeptidase
MNSWLDQQVKQVHESSEDSKTVAVVVSESELKDAKHGFLAHLSKSKAFLDDIAMTPSYWLYHPESQKRVLLVQIKDRKEGADDKARKGQLKATAAALVAALQSKKCDDVHVLCSSAVDKHLFGVFEGQFILENYEFTLKNLNAPKKEDVTDLRQHKILKHIHNTKFVHEEGDYSDNEEYKLAIAGARGTIVARDLCNTRGSVAVPEYMEQAVRKVCGDHPLVKEFLVIKGEELEAKGMGLIYGVGKAACSPPRMVLVHYKGNPDSDDVDFGIVGKGVTFDTGGLNIKLNLIEKMHGDKGGSTAVIGALHGCLEVKPKKNICFVMGFAENSVDAKSYKPSDILYSLKGSTVEIGNTDAEGRLVMADCLTYVQKHYKPKKVFDIATLTGAVIAALGQKTAGIWGHNQETVDAVIESGAESFERFWHMPLFDDHREANKTPYADIKNLGNTPFGGANHAAAFMEHFVEKGTDWCHLDIAGVAIDLGKNHMTGFGSQTLLNFICKKI